MHTRSSSRYLMNILLDDSGNYAEACISVGGHVRGLKLALVYNDGELVKTLFGNRIANGTTITFVFSLHSGFKRTWGAWNLEPPSV